MAQTNYQSTDVGALTLAGQVGSLRTLVDLILTGPSYNGTGNAYGSTPCAGWTRVFSDDANKVSVYRPPASATCRQYYRLNDNAPDGAANWAQLQGYESMSDVDTGLAPCPQSAGTPTPARIRKSASADATVRPWKIFADGRTVKIAIYPGTVGGVSVWLQTYFGEIFSYGPVGDQYGAVVAGESSATDIGYWHSLYAAGIQSTSKSTVAGVGIFREHDHTPDAIPYGIVAHGAVNPTGDVCGWATGPNPADGVNDLFINPIVTARTAQCVRGHYRGVYQVGFPSNYYNDGDIIPGTGNLAGRSFMLLRTVHTKGSSYVSCIAIDLTEPAGH